MRAIRWTILVAGSLILVPLVPAAADAAEPTVLVAMLTPNPANPQASRTATGSATFTIDTARLVIRYRVVYANTTRPVTEVALCAGSAAGRTDPIPEACGFVLVPALPGGSSPIEGSAPIDAGLLDRLQAPGWSAFVGLISSVGSELSGYLGPVPATDTVALSATSRSDPGVSLDRHGWLVVVVVAAIVGFALVGARPRSRGA